MNSALRIRALNSTPAIAEDWEDLGTGCKFDNHAMSRAAFNKKRTLGPAKKLSMSREQRATHHWNSAADGGGSVELGFFRDEEELLMHAKDPVRTLAIY